MVLPSHRSPWNSILHHLNAALSRIWIASLRSAGSRGAEASGRTQRQNRATIVETDRLIRQLAERRERHMQSLHAAAGLVSDGSLLPSPFSQLLSPVESGTPDGCCAGALPRTRECHVSLRDIEALCGRVCTADRWCLVRPGVWVLCTCT